MMVMIFIYFIKVLKDLDQTSRYVYMFINRVFPVSLFTEFFFWRFILHKDPLLYLSCVIVFSQSFSTSIFPFVRMWVPPYDSCLHSRMRLMSLRRYLLQNPDSWPFQSPQKFSEVRVSDLIGSLSDFNFTRPWRCSDIIQSPLLFLNFLTTLECHIWWGDGRLTPRYYYSEKENSSPDKVFRYVWFC